MVLYSTSASDVSAAFVTDVLLLCFFASVTLGLVCLYLLAWLGVWRSWAYTRFFDSVLVLVVLPVCIGFCFFMFGIALEPFVDGSVQVFFEGFFLWVFIFSAAFSAGVLEGLLGALTFYSLYPDGNFVSRVVFPKWFHDLLCEFAGYVPFPREHGSL